MTALTRLFRNEPTGKLLYEFSLVILTLAGLGYALYVGIRDDNAVLICAIGLACLCLANAIVTGWRKGRAQARISAFARRSQ